MKKITLLLLVIIIYQHSVIAQCINSTLNASTTLMPNSGFVEEIASNQETSEFTEVAGLIIGHDYRFTSTHNSGTVDDFITITDITNGTVIASGTSSVSTTNLQYTVVRVHISTDNVCGTDLFFHKTTIENLTNASLACYQPVVTANDVTYKSDTRIDFKWSAPASSSPVGYDWEIGLNGFEVETGTEVIAGSTVAPTTNDSSGDVLTAGLTYQLYLRSDCGDGNTSAWLGPFTFVTNAVEPPVNDYCSGAISILEETGKANETEATPIAGDLNGGAGTDVDAETCNGSTGNARDDVWYSFLAQTQDINILVVPNASVDFIVTLYSGDCNGLSYISCSDDDSSTKNEQITYSNLNIGDTYYIRVYYFNTSISVDRTFNLKLWSSTATTDLDSDGYADTVDCDDTNAAIYQPVMYYEDNDLDGYGSGIEVMRCELTPSAGVSTNNTDCDDTDSAINPDTLWYADGDGDGYGDINSTLTQCSKPDNYVSNSEDCDDTDAAINPGTLWYADGDGDGYGDINTTITQCTKPNNYVSNSEDCDDTDAAINPDTLWYADGDGDGYGDINTTITQCTKPDNYVSNSEDCDDTDAAINPDALWYADSDGDGYGDINTTITQCTNPDNYVSNSEDCDDTDAAINPDALWYADSDGDTYGDASDSMVSCNQPDGYVLNSSDCDDTDPDINPSASEIPSNGVDENCDGVDIYLWFEDADGDGYGNPEVSQQALEQPTGFVSNSSDCDDTNVAIHEPITYYVDNDRDGYGSSETAELCELTAPHGFSTNNTDCDDDNNAIHPGAIEICDDIDNDCDGLTDDDDPNVAGQSTWFADADGDTYGDGSVSVLSCSQPDGYVSNSLDCDDTDDAIHPGAVEICDGIDNDCDGLTDDDDPNVTGQSTWYADADDDGYGDGSVSILSCSQPDGYVSDNTDCDDTNAAIHEPITYYVDNDGDGYGSAQTADICAIIAPTGFSAFSGDSDDADPDVNPDATEICDGIDNNSDGQIDEGFTDTDGDGVADCVDVCPGFDDAVDTNNNNIPDGCESLSLNTNALNHLAIQPNPFNADIFIQIPQHYTYTSFEVIIYDLNGRAVLSKRVQSHNHQIEINNLHIFQQGMYLIKISNSETSEFTIRQMIKF
ncbi:MopE-related protein [Aestuariibaculum marinum]|uniref:T9SS type A sorting domain-containing protein n=1 Tax=Aestuariibaculum marinum TaxID=2683592 RepID=A0A8J6PSG0_9FLAO|nr:MopE-related protein [Aestuariibaculum marinum]MBD0822683.1 T9SS type A sorting domain-containing protein [Aestuariibaculum marinum]